MDAVSAQGRQDVMGVAQCGEAVGQTAAQGVLGAVGRVEVVVGQGMFEV